MAILDLQQDFLQNHNEGSLTQMYEELVKLGKTILAAEKYDNDIDDVYDIASKACLTMLETNRPAIRTAASGYMKKALYYKNKEKFHDSLEDHVDLYTSDEEITSSCEDPEETRTTEDAAKEYFSRSNVKDSGEVRLLVMYTLDKQLSFRQVKKWLVTKENRREFQILMKQIKQELKTQGTK